MSIEEKQHRINITIVEIDHCLKLLNLAAKSVGRDAGGREVSLAKTNLQQSRQWLIEALTELTIEASGCPDCRMPDCICTDDDVERLRSLDGSSAYEQGKAIGRAHALVDSEMVAEHGRIDAESLGLKWETNQAGREQFMEGYGYGFSEKKEEIARNCG